MRLLWSERRLLVGLRWVFVAVLMVGPIACGDLTSRGPGGGRIAVEVLPLALAGVSDARYTLRVTNGPDGAGETVWERSGLSSAQYGDGAGSLSYVGPCDADTPMGSVTLILEALYEGAGVPIPEGDYVNPGALTRNLRCVPNEDVRVSFDLTIVRNAQQGFFDIAVSIEDIFCSAKLDCVDSRTGGDLELLHHNVTGQRDMTAVIGFACISALGGPTHLYMDDVRVDCEGWANPTIVDVSGQGKVDLSAGTSANPNGYLFGASVQHQAADLAGMAYWNISLGLEESAFASAGECNLTLRATATEEPLGFTSGGWMLPANTVYPVIDWNLTLSDAAGRVCTRHEVDVPDSGVATHYLGYLSAPNQFTWASAPIGLRCMLGAGEDAPVCAEAYGECGFGEMCTSSGCSPFGSDGDITLSANAQLDSVILSAGRSQPEQVSYRVSSIVGRRVALTAEPAGIAPGDEVLLINLRGTPSDHGQVGVHERRGVIAVDGPVVTLGCDPTETYSSAGNDDLSSQLVRLVRIPHYASLSLDPGVALTTSAFGNGGGSGIIAFHVDGALTLGAGASISARAAGYAGGGRGLYTSSSTKNAYPGTAIAGPAASRSQSQYYGGGGGGIHHSGSCGDWGSGGGGGAHYTAGTRGRKGNYCVGETGGYGGHAYAFDGDDRWYLGGGGGGGGADYSGDHGNGFNGAAGGGLILIRAHTIVNEGVIRADGGDETGNNTTGDAEEGKGGGGAGGTVVLTTAAAEDAGTVDVSGGVSSGGYCPTYMCGGAGGSGRVVIED